MYKYKTYTLDDFDGEELELAKEVVDNGSQLVEDCDIEEYALEVAYETGVIHKDYLPYFDAEMWARDLSMNYTSVDIGERSFYVIN